jgi:hypothetical protein
MNTAGAVLLNPTRPESPLVPTQRELDLWHEEFYPEEYRFKNLRQDWAGIVNDNNVGVTAASFTGTSGVNDIGPLPDYSTTAGQLQVGMIFRINAMGAFVSSSGATTITLQLLYGGTGGTSFFTTGAVTLTASAGNNWWLENYIRVLTLGTTGTIASFTRYAGISTTANAGVVTSVRTASVASINTETANAIIIGATAGVALTSFNVDTFVIEQLN